MSELQILDREQLRAVTLDDEELQREVLEVLLTDTMKQIGLLETAWKKADANECRKVAHYAKGACANVGAESMAAVLKYIETNAAGGNLEACGQKIPELSGELERLQLAIETA